MNKTGFTLIELMVAISIVAILATIGMMMFSSAQGTARDAKRKGDIEDIKKAMYLYKASSGSFCIPSVACTASSNAYYPISAFYSGYAAGGIPAILSPYLKALPTDPQQASDNTHVYALRITGDSTFEVYGRLEKGGSATGGCTIPVDAYNHNYCISQ